MVIRNPPKRVDIRRLRTSDLELKGQSNSKTAFYLLMSHKKFKHVTLS